MLPISNPPRKPGASRERGHDALHHHDALQQISASPASTSVPSGTAASMLFFLPKGQPRLRNNVDASDAIVHLASTSVLKHSGVMNSSGMPCGALVTPLPPLQSSPLPTIRRAAVACRRCGGYINPYCQFDAGAWTCVMCGESNQSSRVFAGIDPQTCPELVCEAIDYARATTLATMARDGDDAEQSVAFVIDATLDEDDLQVVRNAILQVLKGLPDSAYVALISYDTVVALHDVSRCGMVACRTLPGHTTLNDVTLRRTLACNARFIAPVHTCGKNLQNIVNSIRPYQHFLPHRQRARCMAVAIEAALWLLRGTESLNSHVSMARGVAYGRIIVVTGGPITYGPGQVPLEELDGEATEEGEVAKSEATDYISMLSTAAASNGVPIDIFAAGLSAPNVPLMSSLCRTSGGAFTLHESFGPLLHLNISQAITRQHAVGAVMDVATSNGMSVAQIIGAVSELDDESRREIETRDARKLSDNAAAIASLEHGQGFAVLLRAESSLLPEHIYLQVVIQWRQRDGDSVQRVVTKRMQSTDSVSTYLRSLQPTCCAVLQAKRVIAQAAAAGAASLEDERQYFQVQLGTTLDALSQRFGRQKAPPQRGMFTWFSAKRVFHCPHELACCAVASYHLQRGAMLGSVLGHPDERAVLYALFRQADLALSDAMITPRLYACRDASCARFDRVPAVSMALDSNTSLLLDCGSHIFCWIGSHVAAAGAGMQLAHEEACKSFAGTLVTNRFPIPELRITCEGTGDERYILSRLIPIHKDSEEEQIQQYPALQALSDVEVRWLRQKMKPTDELSFVQWCRLYNVEPPLQDFVAVSTADIITSADASMMMSSADVMTSAVPGGPVVAAQHADSPRVMLPPLSYDRVEPLSSPSTPGRSPLAVSR